jgi:hypothetical protein
MAGRFAVADEEKRREEAALLDIARRREKLAATTTGTAPTSLGSCSGVEWGGGEGLCPDRALGFGRTMGRTEEGRMTKGRGWLY